MVFSSLLTDKKFTPNLAHVSNKDTLIDVSCLKNIIDYLIARNVLTGSTCDGLRYQR